MSSPRLTSASPVESGNMLVPPLLSLLVSDDNLRKSEVGQTLNRHILELFQLFPEESNVDDPVLQSYINNVIMPMRYRRRSIPTFYTNPSQAQLPHLTNWNAFDVTALSPDALPNVFINIFQSLQLHERFQVSDSYLSDFIGLVCARYNQKPYHNFAHAVDVTQATYSILVEMDAMQYLSELDVFSLITAAVGHDLDHPGYNNNFLIKTKSVLAVLYNDISVLENHHASQLVKILLTKSADLLENLSPAQATEAKSVMIDTILATDMGNHVAFLTEIKAKLDGPNPEFKRDVPADRLLLCKLIIKCADISNIARSWTCCQAQCQLLAQEFFNQGDEEKRIGFTPPEFMDRTKTTYASVSSNFIKFVGMDLFNILTQVLPKSKPLLENLQLNQNNLQHLVKS